MSYATVEAAVEAVVIKIAGYSAANVTAGDHRMLAAGQTKAVVIERSGPSSRAPLNLDGTSVEQIWAVKVDIFTAFSDEIDTLKDGEVTAMQEVLDNFDKWPFLDGTSGVLSAFVTSIEEPEEWLLGGRWWRTRMILEVAESVSVTRSE